MIPEPSRSAVRLAAPESHGSESSLDRAASAARELAGTVREIARELSPQVRATARMVEALALTLADELDGLRTQLAPRRKHVAGEP
jgi:ABC-type transporter Mla subunit MlaD